MGPDPVVPDPPDHTEVLVEVVQAGTNLFHGHRRDFGVTAFDPGPRPTGRFSFFESAASGHLVPVFYAGRTEEVAVAETFLHDVPLRGGQLTWAEQDLRVISAVAEPGSSGWRNCMAADYAASGSGRGS